MFVFFKNPVAQSKAAQDPKNRSILNQHLHYGVRLTGLDRSGFLQNSTLSIEVMNGERLRLQTGLKSDLSDSTNSQVEQLMAYYWLNRTVEYFDGQTQNLSVKNKNIRVLVDDSVFGWSSRTNSIHLAKIEDRWPMAFSAEMMVYYLGLANVHYASQGAILNASGDQDNKACGGDPKGCCRSYRGCSRAIASGSADFMAMLMFPDQPILGEAWANHINGSKICDLPRSAQNWKNHSAREAYDLCKNRGRNGEVHAMGALYASIWWEVREAVGGEGSLAAKNIDRIYMEHLKRIEGKDNFQTILAKIEQVDGQLFQGQYSSYFRSEFSRRGLEYQ